MENLPRFPVGPSAHWRDVAEMKIPDPYLRNWLLDTGSLTERLQSMCRRFQLTLLGQESLVLEPEEISLLPETPKGGNWVVREVILWGDGVPWVFARSVICQALIDGELADLGEKPLGKVIFNDSRFTRSAFQLSLEKPPEKLQGLLDQNEAPLWGRRSCFTFGEYAMMVAETFLPEAPAYCNFSPADFIS